MAVLKYEIYRKKSPPPQNKEEIDFAVRQNKVSQRKQN